jgi:hypothetical protein
MRAISWDIYLFFFILSSIASNLKIWQLWRLIKPGVGDAVFGLAVFIIKPHTWEYIKNIVQAF